MYFDVRCCCFSGFQKVPIEESKANKGAKCPPSANRCCKTCTVASPPQDVAVKEGTTRRGKNGRVIQCDTSDSEEEKWASRPAFLVVFFSSFFAATKQGCVLKVDLLFCFPPLFFSRVFMLVHGTAPDGTSSLCFSDTAINLFLQLVSCFNEPENNLKIQAKHI